MVATRTIALANITAIVNEKGYMWSFENYSCGLNCSPRFRFARVIQPWISFWVVPTWNKFPILMLNIFNVRWLYRFIEKIRERFNHLFNVEPGTFLNVLTPVRIKPDAPARDKRDNLFIDLPVCLEFQTAKAEVWIPAVIVNEFKLHTSFKREAPLSQGLLVIVEHPRISR